MSRIVFALLALVFSLAGCASRPDVNRQRMELLPQHYNQFDAALSWDVRRTPSGMIVDGYIRNLRYLPIEDVEVWVAPIDSAGKTMARSVAYVIPHSLKENEIAPFSVKIPATTVPPGKLRFTYKYKISGGSQEGGGDTGYWMQTFDADLPPLP